MPGFPPSSESRVGSRGVALMPGLSPSSERGVRTWWVRGAGAGAGSPDTWVSFNYFHPLLAGSVMCCTTTPWHKLPSQTGPSPLRPEVGDPGRGLSPQQGTLALIPPWVGQCLGVGRACAETGAPLGWEGGQ